MYYSYVRPVHNLIRKNNSEPNFKKYADHVSDDEPKHQIAIAFATLYAIKPCSVNQNQKRKDWCIAKKRRVCYAI